MDSVQRKIGYEFTYDEHLTSAFVAAHRSEEDGVANDGNRGMARIGQIAVEMAETCYAVMVEKARLSKHSSERTTEHIIMRTADINSRKYWWKDKKQVARACKALGLELHIVRSARQTGQVLSPEVLNFALNAVIGAVWLDCQAQNRSISDTCNTISGILSQINTILNLSTAAGGDQDGSLIAENSAQVFPTGPVTHEKLDGNLGSDLDTTEASGNLETYESFSVFPPDSFSEGLDGLAVEQSSPQWFILEQQPFPGQDATELVSQDHDQENVVSSLSSGTQGVGVQPVFSVEQETVIESIMPRTADSGVSITTMSKRALPGRESEDSVGAQLTGSLQRKIKRAQTERDKVSAVLDSLLDAERQKIDAYSEPERTKLLRYLEYPQTTQLRDPCHLFRFLYLAVGSWDTLADFASQLQGAREARRSFTLSSPFPSTASTAFNMICRLDSERTTCILLKRYYAVQLLEEGQRPSQSCESMHVETLETFGFGNTPQAGNPQMRRDAAEIKFLISKIVPGVENTSQAYPTIYSKVKRFRQLGKRLQILTKRFGTGVLVLLPSGPSFPGFSLTDCM
jgi:hypothetical protein